MHGSSAVTIPLHSTRVSGAGAVVCLPGAGASVTSLLPFAMAIGDRFSTYGLQPAGIDPTETPDESVEDAAARHLDAVAALPSPVHLVGHSHGGKVAFELALRLQASGRSAKSVTLIDTESPDAEYGVVRNRDEATMRRDFVRVFEKMHGIDLTSAQEAWASCDREEFVTALHGCLVAHGLLPARAARTMLAGPMNAFVAACRASYQPHTRYDGKIRLVQVRDTDLSFDDDMAERRSHANGWRNHVQEIDVWQGAGHHFSILQDPHVMPMAHWWLGGLVR